MGMLNKTGRQTHHRNRNPPLTLKNFFASRDTPNMDPTALSQINNYLSRTWPQTLHNTTDQSGLHSARRCRHHQRCTRRSGSVQHTHPGCPSPSAASCSSATTTQQAPAAGTTPTTTQQAPAAGTTPTTTQQAPAAGTTPWATQPPGPASVCLTRHCYGAQSPLGDMSALMCVPLALFLYSISLLRWFVVENWFAM